IKQSRAIRRKPGPPFVELSSHGEVSPRGTVRPHHKKIPIALTALAAVDDRALGMDFGCKLADLSVGIHRTCQWTVDLRPYGFTNEREATKKSNGQERAQIRFWKSGN